MNLAYAISFMSGVKHQCKDAGLPGISGGHVANVMTRRGGWAGWVAFSAYGDGAYANLEQEGMDDGYALAVAKGCQSKELQAVHASVKKTIL